MSCFQGQRGLDVHCLRTLIFSSTDAGDADDVTDGEGVQNKSQWTKSQMMIWYFGGMVADMKVQMRADMEVDKVADKVADLSADKEKKSADMKFEMVAYMELTK